MHTVLLIVVLSALGMGKMQAQLIVTEASSLSGWTADSLVRNILLDNGVTISNAKFNGSTGVINCNSIGKFETGNTPTNLGMESGLIIASGGVTVAIGPNNASGLSVTSTCESYYNANLASIASGMTNDVAVLEFDFVPWDNTLTFNFVFGSEEYMEYVGSEFNDVFGFFVDGINPDGGNYNHQNMALIPYTNEVVSINNVNLNHNSNYYVNNSGGSSIQFDGFTTLLEVNFAVVPMTDYHITMAICDVSDSALDSGVFLEAHSFTTSFSHGMKIDEWLYTEIPENHFFCSNNNIEFTTITDWNYDDVVWYFGDGTSAQGEQVSHAYSEDGFYTVTNVLRNPHRSTDSLYISTEIEVRTPSSEIHGLSQVAISTDLWPGVYNYCIADSTNLNSCTIIWECSNPKWILIPSSNPYWCSLIATTLGNANLTAYATCNSSCNTFSSLNINASYFDVEENGMGNVSLFPNPTSTQITIQAPLLSHVRIRNNIGSIVKEFVFEKTDKVSLDIGDLKQGVYFVDIVTANGNANKCLIKL